MSLIWLLLKIAVVVFVVLFTIYFLNLDMKLVAVIYQWLGKHFDNEKKETNL
jgi:hypothetical protein